jgi:hypothetical protein
MFLLHFSPFVSFFLSLPLSLSVVSFFFLPSRFAIVNLLKNDSQRFYKKAAAFVLRAVAKHNASLAQSVVDAGAVDPLVGCLSESEASVKEAAVWALSHLARHNSGMTGSRLAQMPCDCFSDDEMFKDRFWFIIAR